MTKPEDIILKQMAEAIQMAGESEDYMLEATAALAVLKDKVIFLSADDKPMEGDYDVNGYRYVPNALMGFGGWYWGVVSDGMIREHDAPTAIRNSIPVVIVKEV